MLLIVGVSVCVYVLCFILFHFYLKTMTKFSLSDTNHVGDFICRDIPPDTLNPLATCHSARLLLTFVSIVISQYML